METRKEHWEKIYSIKKADELSWFQQRPSASIDLIGELNLPLTAKIFDNGCGDSNLVDYLLEMKFENITVLDISPLALEKTKQRLGVKAEKIKWLVADEAYCNPGEKYDLWHDRAAFHFLTDENVPMIK